MGRVVGVLFAPSPPVCSSRKICTFLNRCSFPVHAWLARRRNYYVAQRHAQRSGCLAWSFEVRLNGHLFRTNFQPDSRFHNILHSAMAAHTMKMKQLANAGVVAKPKPAVARVKVLKRALVPRIRCEAAAAAPAPTPQSTILPVNTVVRVYFRFRGLIKKCLTASMQAWRRRLPCGFFVSQALWWSPHLTQGGVSNIVEAPKAKIREPVADEQLAALRDMLTRSKAAQAKYATYSQDQVCMRGFVGFGSIVVQLLRSGLVAQ
jgi:hypothetical protein